MASAWRTTSRQRHHRRHLGTPPPPLDHTLVVPGLEIGLRHGAWESRPGVGDQGETYPNPLVPDQAGHGQTVSDEEIGLVDGVKERRLLALDQRVEPPMANAKSPHQDGDFLPRSSLCSKQIAVECHRHRSCHLEKWTTGPIS